MTFTYTIGSSDPDTLFVARIRLGLGDVTENTGVRPDNSNFSDEEVLDVKSREDDELERTLAHMCEILSRQWSALADLTIGPRREAYSSTSESWAKRAQTLRDNYGYGDSNVVETPGIIKVDGYSKTTPSDAVAVEGTEYTFVS